MTLEKLLLRDLRIDELERLGRARNAAQQVELDALIYARDSHWRRLPEMVDAARRKVSALEAYSRRHRLSA